jgi:hypothetical protein
MNPSPAGACVKAILFAAFSVLKNGGPSTANIMTRTDLEHLIRAAGSIANVRELIVIGSQAILGTFASAPAELTASQEADKLDLGNGGGAAARSTSPPGRIASGQSWRFGRK